MPHRENRLQYFREAGKQKYIELNSQKLEINEKHKRVILGPPKIIFRIFYYKRKWQPNVYSILRVFQSCHSCAFSFCVHNERVSHWSTFMQLDMVVLPARILSESRLQRHLQKTPWIFFFLCGWNITTNLLFETEYFEFPNSFKILNFKAIFVKYTGCLQVLSPTRGWKQANVSVRIVWISFAAITPISCNKGRTTNLPGGSPLDFSFPHSYSLTLAFPIPVPLFIFPP